MTEQKTVQVKKQNPMRKIKLEKVVLSCGATGPNLEKSQTLLEMLSGKKAQIIKAGPKRRIPNFGVKPNLPLGTAVTLRGKEAFEILKKLLGAIDNELNEKQIAENGFSFGIKEYIEIPGAEYKREIGIRGLNVTACFTRAGIRVKRKKIKKGKVPERQYPQSEEIIEYMEENFDTEIE
ncbi:MAG: 50S ribosomal protein L5 [Nanoarchaeota archaeon]|nr:50S ribosomal protein L5 [Nanoarchaeota archaeon]MBU1051633.1 50S ribosomal protein L5 [Nanoarchaeota archaeon]MBU1988835.1 50S ribosomal protein L5 [Nanoarchaeota archaeon]